MWTCLCLCVCTHIHWELFLAKSTIAVEGFQIIREMERHLNTSLGRLGALKGYHRSSEGGKFLRCVSINQMRPFTLRSLISLTMDTYYVIMKMVTEEVLNCFFKYIWECICNLCCNFVEGISEIYFSQKKEHSTII